MISKANPEEHLEAGTHIPISVSVGAKQELPRSTGFLFYALRVFVGLLLSPLVIACYYILCVIGMPLLVVCLLVLRLLQLLTNGDTYYKVTHVMTIIRILMFYFIISFSALLLVTFISLGAPKVSQIHHITLDEQSSRYWIQFNCSVGFFYVVNVSLDCVIQILSPPMVWQYERGVNIGQAITEIIDCLHFWWLVTLELKHAPPSLKQHHVAGLPAHKWIQVVIFVLIGIDTIAVCCHLITYLLHYFYKNLSPPLCVKSAMHFWVEEILQRKYAMYWADGLSKSIVFVSSSTALVLSWNLYFRTHVNATPEDKKMVHFGTMALASLLILAVLWVIKSCILLSWKVNQVYAQLRPRLLENREELYFLGILGRHKFDILSIASYSDLTISGKLDLTQLPSPPHHRLRCISHNEQHKIITDRVARDEQEEEEYDDLKWSQMLKTILVRCKEKRFSIDFMLNQVVRFIFVTKLKRKIRDDLYIWKEQEEEAEDVQDVKVGGSKISFATMHDLQQMAQYFIRSQPTLSSPKYVPDMLHYLTTSAAEGRSLEQHLEQLIKGKTTDQVKEDLNNRSDSQKQYEWQWFKQLLDKQSYILSSKGINESCESPSLELNQPTSSNEISESPNFPSNEAREPQEIEKRTLEAWLENARGTSMELANTLSSAEEAVNFLDNIMSGLLIFATFIMWLLLTGLATTKILVVIASPLLAATFIFGDACKSLFQGIIFAYVSHPLNVGDVVVIDDKMMEVKILGVWKTIFVEIGKTEEVIYPNSELANKKIINYKSDFDWNDRLEFTLKSFQSDKIEALRRAIKEDLRKDEKCSPNHISTEALASEDDVKVIVHLKYNPDNQHGMTLYERLEEKHNLRSLFSIKIWDLIKEHKTKKD